jgi:hypothetical protein
MQRFIAMCACALGLAAGLFSQAQASVPLLISHQGRLLDAADQPVEGTVDITFRLYDAPSAGTLLWTESYPSVVVTHGLFDVKLGSITPLTLDLLSPPSTGVEIDRYLDVAVSGTSLTPRLRIGSTPYAMASGRVTGDMETAPGEMRIGGMSGSTTATIRASSSGTPGSSMELADSTGSSVVSYTVIATFSDGTTSDMTADADGDGIANSQLQATARFSDGCTMDMTSDADDDGIPESSLKQKSKPSGASSILTGHSGSTTGTIRMMATPDSAGSDWFDDYDADGFPDSRVRVRVTPRDALGEGAAANLEVSADRFANGPRQSVSLDGSFNRAEMRCATDLNLDGIPDVVVAASTDADSAGLSLRTPCCPGHVTLRSGMSGSTTGTIRMSSSLDSTGEVVDHDSDGDGHAESHFTITARDQYGNCQLATDTDDDGVDDNSAVTQCDAIETRQILKGRSGSTTGTIRMSTTGGGGPIIPECVSSMEMDGDSNGHPERWLEQAIRLTSAESIVAADLDGDGVAENSSTTDCDDVSARHVLSGRSGSTTATIRQSVSGGSGVGVAPECVLALDMDEDGDSHREKWIEIEFSELTKSQIVVATDPDDDGVADHSVTTDCDDTDARLVVSNIGSSGQDGVSIDVNEVSRRLSVGNIGSSGQDGVDMEVTSSLRRLTVGNIGSSGQDGVGIEVDASSRRLTVGNIGSSGQDGVSIDVGASSSKLVVHNIGSSGQDGVSILDDGSGGRIAVDTIPTTHKISIGGGGAYCDGTDWVNGSDVNTKENFEEVNGKDILDKIAALSITQWNFKKDGESVKHIGPTAQDFKATFNVGASDKAISTIDPSGIALAAIKALQKQNQYLQTENEQLREALENLNRKVDKLAASR